ncbi:MAG: alpha/beta fold hydrolase, partial [Gammaproteobacteria bacterium]
MIIATNEAELNCEIEGRDGAPWLTFSNSLATDLSMWDDQVEAFASNYRILRYDTRGHGGSSAVPGPYDLDALADDVVALWNELGIKQSHVVGLSIGAMTAVGLALRHAERLNRVVVANARPDNPPELRNARERRITSTKQEGMSGLAELTVERWCSTSFRASNPI